MWQEGRQGSGYFKLKLLESKLFKFDIYLLKFPVYSYIDWHVDPSVEGYEHHRLNLVLKKAEGGVFLKFGYPETNSRINKFRPDLVRHSVTEVTKGTRWVLSFGWLRKNK